MGNNAQNVSTGKPNPAGGVWVAPLNTTLPTDATSQLDGAFKCLGYVSDAGVENANDLNVSVIKAWGGNIVYRSLTELNDTFKFALIESENIDALKSVYGDDNVTVTAGGDIKIDVVAEDPEELVWVIELKLRGDRAKRIIIKDGAVTARDSIKYTDGDPIAYGITVSAYPDSSGKTHYEFIEGDGGSH